MKAQDLKKSILQLAIQGKLVEQDPNDEPATVLLERIKAEKAAFVKAGKIKKDKVTSFIYKTSDGYFHENINGVDKDISDELPFDIPDSWMWVRLKNISDTYTGNSISEAEKNKKYTGLKEGFNYIGTKDVSFSHEIDYENGIKIPFSETTFKHAFPHAILMCIEGGSAGRKIALLNKEVCFGNKLCAFHPFIIPSEYIYIFLQTPYFLTIFKENLSGIIGGVSINKIKELLVPLPPLTEQKRIVVKIEELEPLIEEYDTAETALTALNTAFPEQMKKSILQQAIQGKLVEQDPNDESATVLLERIKAEKAALVKAGKIKKDKVTSFIYKSTDDTFHENANGVVKDISGELPFDIPDSWTWVRLQNLIDPNRSITYGIVKLGDDVKDGIKVLRCSDVHYRYIDSTSIRSVDKKISDQYSRTILKGGEVLVNIRGTLGGCAIVDKNVIGYNIAREVAILPISPYIYNNFILDIISSPYFQRMISSNLRGIAYKGLNLNILSNLLIPLPPLTEQKRIVAKIEELMLLNFI